MNLLPLCGPLDDGSGFIPPGPSYVTPDPTRAGEGRALMAEAALGAVSIAACACYAAQLQLDDLAEVLVTGGEEAEPVVEEARAACTSARRSLRVALLALTALRDRLVPPRGGLAPPPRQPRRRC